MKNFFWRFKIENYPSKSQWQTFFKTPQRFLTRFEKFAFFFLLTLFWTSLFFLILNFYLQNSRVIPAQGGTYIEGVVGQPRFINPIYAQASDIDRDLTELIFSGLMKYDKQGKIVLDLAKSYEIQEEGKVYEVELKENLFWSDGKPLTADDVIFTIGTIQNSDYRSPVIVNWLGVKVEKVSGSRVKFILRNPYGSFLENLTQKILPQHIWQDINPENFPLVAYNLKPIGSGPYQLQDLKQDKLGRIVYLDLIRNPEYHGKNPFLSQISFRFYAQEEDLVKSYQRDEIQGFSLTSLSFLKQVDLSNLNKYSLLIPRYFAVFFNADKSSLLADPNIRQALNYGTNKEKIINEILSGQGEIVHSPILPEIYGFSLPSGIYNFNQETAENLLSKSGFTKNESGLREKIISKQTSFQFKSDLKLESRGSEVEELQKCLAKDPGVYPEGTISGYFGEQTREAVISFQEKYAEDILKPWGFEKGTGLVAETTRNKLNELCFPQSAEVVRLKISLATANQLVLISAAEQLKAQWSNLGVEVEINTFDISQLEKDVIKPRNYQALLFGQVLTMIPDPFAFWHSNQIKDPGLNLAIYQNKESDKLLEESRQAIDEKTKKEKLEQFQNLVIKESPAVFLYNPAYIYFVSSEIKGVEAEIIPDPSKRFADIEGWHIKTKRAWQ